LDDESKKFVEHLAIVISKSNQHDRLININQLKSGKAEEIFQSMKTELSKYSNLTNIISCVCHDTPNVNTGRKGGVVIKLIEYFESLNKFLFNAPCRNHIDELILSASYVTLFGKPSGPSYPMFVDFQKHFDKLNIESFESCDYEIENELQILEFIDHQLSKNSKRKDYREALELSRLFITKDVLFTIKKPGCDSQSRWLSKWIYSLKIYLFRNQLRDLNFKCSFTNLRHFCFFCITVYMKGFFENSLSTYCVLNDLNKLKSIQQFYCQPIKLAASKSFNNHLDYLKTSLSSFALFDERIDNKTKEKMVFNLKNKENKITVIDTTTEIDDLFDSSNLVFLRNLNLNLDFLDESVDE